MTSLVVASLLGCGQIYRGSPPPADTWAVPGYDKSGTPVINVSWDKTLFKGEHPISQILIFRDDVGDIPIGVVGKDATSFTDTPASRRFEYIANKARIGSAVYESVIKSVAQSEGLVIGRPHVYSVAAIYRVRGADLPIPLSQREPNFRKRDFYFRSDTAMSDSATALGKPFLLSPAVDELARTFPEFRISAIGVITFPIRVAYVVQLSASPDFDRRDVVYTTSVKTGVGTRDVTIALEARYPGDSLLQFLAETLRFDSNNKFARVWWRVGYRNVDDVPGPAPTAGSRPGYLYSEARSFKVR